MGEEELRNTLTYLIKVYVMDNNSQTNTQNNRLPDDKNISFFDLMTSLKREYNTPELAKFQLESGQVFLEMDNKRVAITNEDTTQTPPAPVMSPPDTAEAPQNNGNPSNDAPTNNGAPGRFGTLEF